MERKQRLRISNNNLLEKGWAKKQPFIKRLDQKQPFIKRLDQKQQKKQKNKNAKNQPFIGEESKKRLTETYVKL